MGSDTVQAKTTIIAEVGINHNADLDTARKLIDAAKNAGADIVKFQTFWCFPDLRQYEFSEAQWVDLIEYCKASNIRWASTPFDQRAVEFLKLQGMNIWKIPSGMVTNERYLKTIANVIDKDDWIIVSTGMCTYDEAWKAIFLLEWNMRDKGRPYITALHCTTAYPAEYREANLKAMFELKTYMDSFSTQRVPSNYGLSDHTPGIYVPIAAVAMGASVIEKHITLDRSMEGPDHKASLEPDEFAEMARAIRIIEQAMGDGVKRPTETEMKHRDEIRKRMEEAI